MAKREYDIVLYGATGFTGELTARHLLERMPKKGKWALAGRNLAKLEEVRDEIGAPDLPLIQADSGDAESLRAMAESARVVVTTVGPYTFYGEPLVKACAEAGTTYIDLTGEPEFVDSMYVKYNAIAEARGARLIHSCGFDSIPHDLGAYFTVQQLPSDVPIKVRGVVRSNATFSGGTFHSLMAAAPRARQMRQAMMDRKKIEPKATNGRRVKMSAGKPHKDPDLGYYLLPLPTLDPAVVAGSAKRLDAYGPDFTYSHYAGLKTLKMTVAAPIAIGALVTAAQIKPLREQMKKRVPAGHGPSQARRDASYFTVDFIGEGGGKKVHTRVSGGDPGYTETAKMLGESALCLAFDDNPETSGQVTTATAMGDNLMARLQDVGIKFDVL